MRKRLITIMCIGLFVILVIGKVQYTERINKTNMIEEKAVIADSKSVPFEYTQNTSITNGDVVISNNSISNKYRLDEFMKNIKNKKLSKIRVVTYTDSNIPLIESLYFNGEKIVLVTDNTRDDLINSEYREIKRYNVSQINYHNKDGGVLYVATLDTGEKFDILYYESIKK